MLRPCSLKSLVCCVTCSSLASHKHLVAAHYCEVKPVTLPKNAHILNLEMMVLFPLPSFSAPCFVFLMLFECQKMLQVLKLKF